MKVLSVEGVHRSICRVLCHWWSENQHASQEDIVQKTVLFTYQQENKSSSDKLETVSNKDHQKMNKKNRSLQSRGCPVLNVESLSPPTSPHGSVVPSPINDSESDATALLVSDPVAAVNSSVFDLDYTTSTESTPFCRVSLNDKYKHSRWQQVKNIATYFERKIGTLNVVETDKSARANSLANIAIMVSTIGVVSSLKTSYSQQTEV